MSEVEQSPFPSAEVPATLVDVAPSRARLVFETAAVICLAVVPDIGNVAMSLIEPLDAPHTFGVIALSLILRSVQVCVPVLYIMWRSGEGLARFGLVRPHAAMDLLLGCVIWGLAWVVHVTFWGLLSATPGAVEFYYATLPAGLEGAFGAPSGAGDWVLLVLMSVSNGFAEQLVVTAFLITRLEVLLRGSGRAVMAAAALFAAYHLYQGPVFAAEIMLFGLVHGVIFVATRRLWPLAVAHALADIVAYA